MGVVAFAAARIQYDRMFDIAKQFLGFGKLTAREIVYRAFGDSEKTTTAFDPSKLWESFSQVMKE